MIKKFCFLIFLYGFLFPSLLPAQSVLDVITTFAGNGAGAFGGDGGPAVNASLREPFNTAVDASGNVYIADFFNHRIRKVDTSGDITTYAGTGLAGFTGDGGQATSAKLLSPSDVVLDSQGNLYIVDSGNNRIRKVDTGGIITTDDETGMRTVHYINCNYPRESFEYQESRTMLDGPEMYHGERVDL